MNTKEEVLKEIIEQEGDVRLPTDEEIQKYTHDRIESRNYDICGNCSNVKKRSHTKELFRVNNSGHKIYICSICNEWEVGGY